MAAWLGVSSCGDDGAGSTQGVEQGPAPANNDGEPDAGEVDAGEVEADEVDEPAIEP